MRALRSSEIVERPRLIPRITIPEDLPTQPRTLLFVGMAGSGKTTACHSYLQQLPRPAFLIDLRPGETGWQAIQRLLVRLDLPTAQPVTALTEITQPLVIVIDQLESILDPQGMPVGKEQDWLETLIHNPSLHLVLLSRIFPSFPAIINLLAQGDLQVIDGGQLAFTVEETRALWQMRQGNELPREKAQRLVSRSGGLAALIALACSTGTLPDEEVIPLGEEFIERAIGDLPSWLYNLLLETSVLPTLTPTAVETLTGYNDPAHLLREVRRWNLLVAERPPLLQPLVRQSLLRKLRADRPRFSNVGKRAVALAIEEEDFHQAWQLAYETQLWDEARCIIYQAGPRLRQQGNSRTLLDWIAALPPGEVDTELAILRARAQSDLGDLDGAMLTISAQLGKESDPARARELRIWLANIEQARGDLQAADTLIVPYLDDESLSPLWRARVYRIHAIALALAGHEEAALRYGARAIEFAHASSEPRILALAYQDHGVMALQTGRFAEADRSLRLAERCWRDLDHSPEMAVTLNARAMAALARRDLRLAGELAQQARLHALAGGRSREASLASNTCGDVALAQQQYDEALLHYQVAADDSQQCGDLSRLIYSLSLQAHVARLQSDRTLAAQLLYNLRSRTAASARDRGWLVSGVTAAQLTLGLAPDLNEMRRALQELATSTNEARGALLILLAQILLRSGQRQQALESWHELEQYVHGRGNMHARLIPIASADLRLIEEVLAQGQAVFAETVLAFQRGPQPGDVTAQPAPPIQRALTVRLLGREEVLWQGRPLELPGRGNDLLILLILSSHQLEDEELLRHIWGEGSVTLHSLQKLVVTLRALMPGLIKRSGRRYILGLPREAIEVDVERFLGMDLQREPTDQLLTLAEAASRGCLQKHESPWAQSLRRQVSRRLALAWLEIGRRMEDEGNHGRAREAFDYAQQAEPTSDFIARAAMQHALRSGDRPLAIQHFLRYQQALDEELGVEPAEDLQSLYRQAIEP